MNGKYCPTRGADIARSTLGYAEIGPGPISRRTSAMSVPARETRHTPTGAGPRGEATVSSGTETAGRPATAAGTVMRSVAARVASMSAGSAVRAGAGPGTVGKI